MVRKLRLIVHHWMRWFKHGVVLPIICHRTTLCQWNKINLCCGSTRLLGYCGIDLYDSADVIIDLAKRDLPFRDCTIDVLVCMSAINYFTRKRGQELVSETYRVLKPGGIARFGVQDMKSLAKKYVDNDVEFFFQKLPGGRERFEGPTIGDKFAAWFYGYHTAGGLSRYFYDFESLGYLFRAAGFPIVERRDYRDSRLPDVEQIDNRPEQMFFLEAVK